MLWFLQPSVYIFDRETRSDEQVADLNRRKIAITEYRMIENYFLHPSAIASVLTDSNQSFTSEDIENWLTAKLWAKAEKYNEKQKDRNKYFKDTDFEKFSPKQDEMEELTFRNPIVLKYLHGGMLLHDLLQQLTNSAPIVYSKVRHGFALVQWLLENDPEHLRGLAEELDECFILNRT